MSADRFSTGKSTDGLVYNSLENRSGKVFSCSSFIDERLDVRLCENTTAGSNRIDCLVIFCIFI